MSVANLALDGHQRLSGTDAVIQSVAPFRPSENKPVFTGFPIGVREVAPCRAPSAKRRVWCKQ